MSFLSYHEQELERRISMLDVECDLALSNIKQLQMKARTFPEKLPGDKVELKSYFLWCTKQLDEYMYHVSEFNIIVGNLENNFDSETPNGYKTPVLSSNSLSDGKRQKSTSSSHSNVHPQSSQTKRTRAEQMSQTDLTNYIPHASQTAQSNQRIFLADQPLQTDQTPEYQNLRPDQKLTSQKSTNVKSKSSSLTDQTRTEQLILFSSASCSDESMSRGKGTEKTTAVRKMDGTVTGADAVGISLPPQSKLEPGSVFKATIFNVDGANLWLITDIDELNNLINDMTAHYKQYAECYVGDVREFGCCAYYDEEDTKNYLRALYMKTEESDVAEVYLVDTGETRCAGAGVRRLAERYCAAPPLARYCRLAAVSLPEDAEQEDRQTAFLSKYLLQEFTVELATDETDNDSSESLCVFIYLEDGTTLNERLTKELSSDRTEQELTIHKPVTTPSYRPHDDNGNKKQRPDPVESAAALVESAADPVESAAASVESAAADNVDLDIELSYNDAEYENPVEAVTGYSNRDEMDICKHYRGGEERSCFKGARCKKRHVMMHPDGWTLDRVAAPGRIRPAPLPAPGSRHAIRVTYVRDALCFFAQFPHDEVQTLTLDDLVEEMTRMAPSAPPLQMEPAVGELVAARYADARWYRARVAACAGAARTVQVLYIDYGNTAEVPDSELRALGPRWLALPAQATACRLAGVSGTRDTRGASGANDTRGVSSANDTRGVSSSSDTRVASSVLDAAVTETFIRLALDKTLSARVIARGYDELTIELFDLEGFSIAEQLCLVASVPLEPYQPEDDSRRLCLHVPA